MLTSVGAQLAGGGRSGGGQGGRNSPQSASCPTLPSCPPAAKPVNWPPAAMHSEADARADLRAVHWQTGYRQEAPPFSEAHQRYVAPRNGKSAVLSGEVMKELRTSHIDLEFGSDKTSKSWQAQQSGDLSKHAPAKYQAKKSHEARAIGAELRKCNLCFSDRTSATGVSEKAARFPGHPAVDQAPELARLLGKDLKASHIDLSNGSSRDVSDWHSMCGFQMSLYEEAKYANRRQDAADLSFLRKSSVPLGSAHERTHAIYD